ncbi:MAG: hypothetical protein ACE5E4_13195 [Candidatus Binatia bacterium]
MIGHRFLEPIEEVALETSGGAARRAVEALGARGKTTRIPDAVRLVVLGYAGQARSAGQSWRQVSETVGLSSSLLQRWNRAGSPRAKLKPVVVAEALPSVEGVDLVLATAHGERLEGLGVEDAIRILRGLR